MTRLLLLNYLLYKSNYYSDDDDFELLKMLHCYSQDMMKASYVYHHHFRHLEINYQC